jgi:hypothetical protein
MPITRRVMIAAAATAALPTAAAVAKPEVHDVDALQNAFNLLHDVVFDLAEIAGLDAKEMGERLEPVYREIERAFGMEPAH